jgi:TetR/AcrR family transcriptional regulator, acrAB operon repressor
LRDISPRCEERPTAATTAYGVALGGGVARRTKEAAAITREQLLDAAEGVFRERGVAGSTLGEVAAKAGVTRGAVYWHFRDKSDLYAAMCERATLPLQTMVERAGGSPHADPMAALRELALTALARLACDARAQAVFDVMFHKTERATGLQAVAVRERRERGHCLLQVERVLAQAVEKRQLPADTDTALATRALYAYIEGVMDQWVLDPGAFDLAAAAPALVDTMLAGLRAAPPRRVREAAALPGKRSLAASAKRRGGKA